MKQLLRIFSVSLFSMGLAASIGAQAAKPKKAQAQPIFAVLHDGTVIEPVGILENGVLSEVTPENSPTFSAYYRPKEQYKLIHGGAAKGSIKVVEAGTGECSGSSADVVTQNTTTKYGRFVMGLATNAPNANTKSFRRAVTTDERREIDDLVKLQFRAKKASAATLKTLKAHNLTAIDVDNDGKAEFVGSFWVQPTLKTRATLFVIMKKNSRGAVEIVAKEYSTYKEADVMSGDIKALDEGMYHILLLDVFDIDGDGVAEIFTTTQGFEGRTFAVYGQNKAGWKSNFSSYNYRCAY